MTGPIQFQAYAPTITLERETRTIRGTITAYGVPTSDYRRIVMHEGALRPRMPLSRVKMLIDHDPRQPVGFMVELAKDGATAAFKIPEGDAGDKALADAEKGLRDGLSVGIQVADEDGAFTYDAEHGTYHVYAAELVEVSLCAIPAYQDAGVTSVAAARQTTPTERNTMEPDTLTAAAPLALTASALDDALDAHAVRLERSMETRLAALSDTAPATGATWPTFGAFLKALTSGDSAAETFYQELAYDGATSSDAKQSNAWVNDTIRLLQRNRKVLGSFNTEPMPPEGMTLEYLELDSNTTKVEKQSAEGAALPKGKIKLKSSTVDVATYGGYTELTKQIIDRASAAYVTTSGTAMDLEYARATEAVVRGVVKALIAQQLGTTDKLAIASGADTYGWLDLIVDAGMKFEDLGYSLDGSYVSVDVFKKLLRLEDSNGNSLMRVYGQGVNQVGEIDLRQITGNLASVEFKLLPDAAANTMAFYDPLAVTTWESPGAPFQLQQENVINLSTAFSKYGYLASASQFPQALVPVQITGTPAP